MVADDSARPVEGVLALPAPSADIAELKALEAVELQRSDDSDLPFLYLNTSSTGSRSTSLASINFTGAKKISTASCSPAAASR